MAADPPHCLPFEKLLSGKNEYGACGENVGFPSWYNPKLLKDGQSFAQRYFFGLYYSHALSLLLLLGQTENRRLLYYTGKSETPFKACRRYLATLLQIKLWYETDFESPDLEVRLSISTVRQIHVNVERVLQAKDPKPNFRVPNVLNPETPSTSSKTVPSIWKCFRADLINSNIVQVRYVKNLFLSPHKSIYTLIISLYIYFPYFQEVEGHKVEPEDRQSKISDNEIPRTPEEKVHCYISQYDMAITQWSFMALPILFPKKLGIRGTKEEDFIGFIHLWAVIGYLLGIQDNYNICLQRDLTECKEYCMDIFTKCMIPELLEVDYETEVMWMALLEVSYYLNFMVFFNASYPTQRASKISGII